MCLLRGCCRRSSCNSSECYRDELNVLRLADAFAGGASVQLTDEGAADELQLVDGWAAGKGDGYRAAGEGIVNSPLNVVRCAGRDVFIFSRLGNGIEGVRRRLLGSREARQENDKIGDMTHGIRWEGEKARIFAYRREDPGWFTQEETSHSLGGRDATRRVTHIYRPRLRLWNRTGGRKRFPEGCLRPGAQYRWLSQREIPRYYPIAVPRPAKRQCGAGASCK